MSAGRGSRPAPRQCATVRIGPGDRPARVTETTAPGSCASFDEVLIDGRQRGRRRSRGSPEKDTLLGGRGTDGLRGGAGVDRLFAPAGTELATDRTADRLRGGREQRPAHGQRGREPDRDGGPGVDKVRRRPRPRHRPGARRLPSSRSTAAPGRTARSRTGSTIRSRASTTSRIRSPRPCRSSSARRRAAHSASLLIGLPRGASRGLRGHHAARARRPGAERGAPLHRSPTATAS